MSLGSLFSSSPLFHSFGHCRFPYFYDILLLMAHDQFESLGGKYFATSVLHCCISGDIFSRHQGPRRCVCCQHSTALVEWIHCGCVSGSWSILLEIIWPWHPGCWVVWQTFAIQSFLILDTVLKIFHPLKVSVPFQYLQQRLFQFNSLLESKHNLLYSAFNSNFRVENSCDYTSLCTSTL